MKQTHKPITKKNLKKVKKILRDLEQNRRIVKVRKIDPQSEEGQLMRNFPYPKIAEIKHEMCTSCFPCRLRRMDVINLIHDLANTLRDDNVKPTPYYSSWNFDINE
tara:strand:+ start:858 stop:1175 length:318 start_codon:yes stop_codon:yes gene_type:complete